MQNPVATVLLGVALGTSLSHIPHRDFRQQSTLGDALAFGGHPHFRLEVPVVYAVRRGGTFHISNPEEDSWDEMSRVIAERPGDVFAVSYSVGLVYRRGTYAPTHETCNSVASIDRVDRQPTSAEEDQAVRAVFVDWLARADHGRYATDAQRFASGTAAGGMIDWRDERVLWGGYVHDVAAAIAVIGFVVSLAWIPRAPAYLASTRRQRRLARGLCPNCKYSIAGLTDTVCPECGRSWNLTAEDEPSPGPA